MTDPSLLDALQAYTDVTRPDEETEDADHDEEQDKLFVIGLVASIPEILHTDYSDEFENGAERAHVILHDSNFTPEAKQEYQEYVDLLVCCYRYLELQVLSIDDDTRSETTVKELGLMVDTLYTTRWWYVHDHIIDHVRLSVRKWLSEPATQTLLRVENVFKLFPFASELLNDSKLDNVKLFSTQLQTIDPELRKLQASITTHVGLARGIAILSRYQRNEEDILTLKDWQHMNEIADALQKHSTNTGASDTQHTEYVLLFGSLCAIYLFLNV